MVSLILNVETYVANLMYRKMNVPKLIVWWSSGDRLVELIG